MERTVYYRYPDGSVEVVTVTVGGDDESPAPPEGAVEIDRQTYEAELAAIEAAREERRRRQADQEQVQQLADYQALTAAGIPEATARRMSGYTGDDHSGDDEDPTARG